MNIAILNMQAQDKNAVFNNYNLKETARLLSLDGHDIITSLSTIAPQAPALKDLEFLASNELDAIIITGDYVSILAEFKKAHSIKDDFIAYLVDNKMYFFIDSLSTDYITNTLAPALNSRQKSVYRSCTFKTFGLTKDDLLEKLKTQMRTKTKAYFKLVSLGHKNFEVILVYCIKSKKEAIELLVKQTNEALKDNIYSLDGSSLASVIIKTLELKNKTLSVAESFTGGALSAALVNIEGASKVFKEGVCAYSDNSKLERLGVSGKTLNKNGAISIETAYEMAAKSLALNSTDYCIATTGNASNDTKTPTPCTFFIAVGSSKGIHIYDDLLSDSRQQVIEYGVNTALFHLYKIINSN